MPVSWVGEVTGVVPDAENEKSLSMPVAMGCYPVVYGILQYLDFQSLQLFRLTNRLIETLSKQFILKRLRSCISAAEFRLIGPSFVLDDKGDQKTYWSSEITNTKFPQMIKSDGDTSRQVFRFDLGDERSTRRNYLTIWDYFDRLEMIIPRDYDEMIIPTYYDHTEIGEGVFARFELDKNIENWDQNVVFEGDFLNDEGKHSLIQRFKLYLRKHAGDREGRFLGLFSDFVELRLGFVSEEGHWRLFLVEFDGDKLTGLDAQ